MSVTVVSCVYGDFHRFVPAWWAAIERLDPAEDDVSIGDDYFMGAPAYCNPQAFHLNRAMREVKTEWAWICDIDDVAYTDALAGLEDVAADVWQMGFDRSDGERYIPPQLSNEEYLASDKNVYVGASAVRVDAFRAVGGFPDVALQDWALWRRLARAGFSFQSSGRAHFRYERHPDTRGETELTLDVRAGHLAEMMEAELETV